jgi:hypothetical protein
MYISLLIENGDFFQFSSYYSLLGPMGHSHGCFTGQLPRSTGQRMQWSGRLASEPGSHGLTTKIQM